MGRPIVELKHVEKYYGTNHVIKDLNLAIAPGEFLTLLGPSGCGKTTTLRMISGFEAPTSGEIDLSGESVAHRAPNERDVNTVFQNYALFPNMTVAENIAYGLKVKKVPKAKIKTRVAEMLKLVQLTGFEKRKPSQLSGGQKQRVAIARALAGEPKVLLLDEPLGALDYKLRKQMQVELKHLQKRLDITFVFVTHDQEEALTMSDRIAVMNGGRIEQLGTPHEIYDHPATPFVAGFIGESNPFDAVVNTFPTAGEQTLTLGTENGIITVAKPEDSAFSFGDLVKVSVRPEKLYFSKTPVKGFGIRGVVRDHLFVGNMIKMIVALNDGSKVRLSRVDADELAPVGDVVYLYFKPEDARVFATKTWFKTDAQQDLKEVIDEANATHFG